MPIKMADGGRVVITLEFEPPTDSDEIAEELREMADRVEQAEQARSDVMEFHSKPA